MTQPRNPDPEPIRLLFVCLGNICRSPLAKGVFAHLSEEAKLASHYQVESAGTGAWHVGAPPDPRSLEVARRHGMELRGTARQVREDDFHAFDLILAMDRENLQALQKIGQRTNGRAKLALLLDFDPDAEGPDEVPDPYYGGPAGFDQVFEMVRRACGALLETLEAERESGGSLRGIR